MFPTQSPIRPVPFRPTTLLLALLAAAPASAQQVLRVYDGEHAGDAFGYDLARAGDVDGDDVPDLVVGAPGAEPHGFRSGKAYVFSGRDGSLLWSYDGASVYFSLGQSVTGMGDVNGDGRADVAVTAIGEVHPGSSFGGTVHVYSGANGAELYAIGSPGALTFGSRVRSIGDTDGDGIRDLAVGAPMGYPVYPAGSGLVFLYSGRNGVLLRSIQGAGLPNDRFGETLADAGDVDADGRGDIVVSAPFDDTMGNGAGVVRVFSGRTGTLLFAAAGTVGSIFGAIVSGAGDVDGDGRAEVLVGPVAIVGQGVGYSVRLLRGSDGSVLRELRCAPSAAVAGGDLDADGIPDVVVSRSTYDAGDFSAWSGSDGSSLFRTEGLNPWPTYGRSLAFAGDVDRDGFDDLLVGDWDAPSNGERAGRVLVLSPCPLPTRSICSTSPNSVGPGARMSSSGTTDLSQNDLVLLAEGMPPGVIGFFLLGSARVSVPFGDGVRCVGEGPAGLFRSALGVADGSGTLARPLDVAHTPGSAIRAGTTWYFQAVYRDPAGPGGSRINLSDGLRGTFSP